MPKGVYEKSPEHLAKMRSREQRERITAGIHKANERREAENREKALHDDVVVWWLWRQMVKERADFTCERCGKTQDEVGSRNIQAHHRDRDSDNNKLSNGVCLCRMCHGQEHIETTLRAIEKARKNVINDPKTGQFTNKGEAHASGTHAEER